MRKWLITLSISAGLFAQIGSAGAQSSPVNATAPLTAQQFEDFVTGRTLTYARNGNVYGVEEYLENRRVRWQFSADICQYGNWYARQDMICFEYEQSPGEHCWKFWLEGRNLRALSISDAYSPSGPAWDQSLTQVSEAEQGLSCPGPDVGV